MMDRYNDFGHLEKVWARVVNITRRVKLNVVDDSGQVQTHQTEGFKNELRPDIPRVQEYGVSTVPLPGSHGVTLSSGGSHSAQSIISTNDPRYRPKNQKPGEYTAYIVDGADQKGENGTLRNILQGALKWVTSLTGKTVNVGDNKEATTIVIGVNPDSVTINMGSSSKATVNINGAKGDCKIDGVSLTQHTHGGVQTGSGHTAQPDKS